MENNLNDKNITLMEKLMKLSGLLRRLSAPRFGHEGPRGRSQERALTQIALRDGISQRELLEKLGIQPSSMSELLGKLEKGGMIERRQNEDDHRQVNLYINESGRRYLERVNDADRNLIPFDALTTEEQEEFEKMLDKLISGAENACADQGLPIFPPRPRGIGEGDFNPPRDACPPPHGRRMPHSAPFDAPEWHRPPHFGGAPHGSAAPEHDSRFPTDHERGNSHRPPFGEDFNPAERGSDHAMPGRGRGFQGRPPYGEPRKLPNINPTQDKPQPVNLGEIVSSDEPQKI